MSAPTLRSITETAPFMHDGVFKTLEEVVDFLDQGWTEMPYIHTTNSFHGGLLRSEEWAESEPESPPEAS